MNTAKTTPKDFFLHLTATIALYVSAVSLINLTFSTINYALPDTLSGYFSATSITWPIAILIILIPTLYVLEWYIGRDLKAAPEKHTLWIRRWRIYLTLFLTGISILGTLVTLLYTFLNGEISSRFIYKVLVVLLVAGVIFAYYILDKMNDANKKGIKTVLSWAGVVIVIAAIIAGFVIVGSPAKQRAIRFDNQRVSDLTSIQYGIASYWQQNGKIPSALSELNDSISGYIVPTDPVTTKAYEYNIKGTTSFELCSDFALPAENNKGRGGYDGYTSVTMPYPGEPLGNESWAHPEGHVCFERTIDPAKYPVTPKNRI